LARVKACLPAQKEEKGKGRSQTMKRIQRKRCAGWCMPPNTVYVGRPSKWGNPYSITSVTHLDDALTLYRGWLKEKIRQNPDFLEPLRGKDVACWCRIDSPCHADILLEFLEKEGVDHP
jgi:hypothetical protein